MPIPLAIPVALAFIAVASQSGKKDTRTDPNDLFDSNLPPDVRKNLEDTLVDPNIAWPGLVVAAYQMQNMGYDKTARSILAVANGKRQIVGLPPIAYPITPVAYAQATQEAANIVKVGPVIPGPGGGISGIPEPGTVTPGDGGTTTTTRTTPPIGGTKVTTPVPPSPPQPVVIPMPQVTPVPGGGVSISIPGQPPIVLAGPPAVVPGTTPNPYAPPTMVGPGVYPTGTHTRPDGTFGYTTQKGDVTTQIMASKFGRTGPELMAANPGVDWNHNYAGTDLNIPPEWLTKGYPPAGPRGPNPPGQKSKGKTKDDGGPGVEVFKDEGGISKDFKDTAKKAIRDLGGVKFSLDERKRRKTMKEIVLQPPSIRVVGGRERPESNTWCAMAEIQSPYGPASVEVHVTIPQVMRDMAIELFHRMIQKAAEKHIAWYQSQNPEIAAGFLGISLPNPAKLIADGAKSLVGTARNAARSVVNQLPAPVRKVVNPILDKLESAGQMTAPMLTTLVKKAIGVIGQANIPGTSINIMALHPIGAVAVIGSKIIGKKATREILNEAVGLVQGFADAGKVSKAAPGMAMAKAVATASTLAADTAFARSIGIPTAIVPDSLKDAARVMVGTLRGVYEGDPKAIAALTQIGQRASAGDVQSRMLWDLASRLSKAGNGSQDAFSVGDGYGPGYGVAGYYPPAPSAALHTTGRNPATPLDCGVWPFL